MFRLPTPAMMWKHDPAGSALGLSYTHSRGASRQRQSLHHTEAARSLTPPHSEPIELEQWRTLTYVDSR